MIDVVFVLLAVGFWGDRMPEMPVSAKATIFATRHECMAKRAEVIETAERVKLPASVECIAVPNPEVK